MQDWLRELRWLARWRVCAAWLAATCLASGCGADATVTTDAADTASADIAADLTVADVPGDATAAADPLVGTWKFSGSVPAIVGITFTLNADKTFTFAETIAPPTWPAGYVPNACVTTDFLAGSYATTTSGGTNTLTLSFASGIANHITGCENGAGNTPGVPMTDADITGYTAEGLLLPKVQTYTVTATSLVLAEPNGKSKTYTK